MSSSPSQAAVVASARACCSYPLVSSAPSIARGLRAYLMPPRAGRAAQRTLCPLVFLACSPRAGRAASRRGRTPVGPLLRHHPFLVGPDRRLVRHTQLLALRALLEQGHAALHRCLAVRNAGKAPRAGSWSGARPRPCRSGGPAAARAPGGCYRASPGASGGSRCQVGQCEAMKPAPVLLQYGQN